MKKYSFLQPDLLKANFFFVFWENFSANLNSIKAPTILHNTQRFNVREGMKNEHSTDKQQGRLSTARRKKTVVMENMKNIPA